MDKRLLTVVMAAILVALVITGIFYQITASSRGSAVAEKRTLVVAKNALDYGVPLTEADVTVVDWPAEMYPQGGFEDIAEVTGRQLTQAVQPNDAITSAKVADPGQVITISSVIPEGYRAMAVAVNQVSGVSGFIMPGSRVDVLLSASPGDDSGELLTTTVLENVTVLSTGHRQQPNQNGQPENVPVVNMILTPEEAELLTMATREGQIQLVLRNPRDEEKTAEEREAKRIEDLFRHIKPKPQPQRPRQIAVRRAPVQMEPPPPAIFQVEMIRGDKRTLEEVDGASN